MSNLTICSYNIHKGFSTSSRRFVLNDIRHAIKATNADMIFLQEIMGENHRPRSDINNQLEFLADDSWPHHAYGKNAIYHKGHHGNAILSKQPFIEQYNINISHWKFSQRGLLIGKTSSGIYVICVHFGLFDIERKRQLHTLIDFIHTQIPAHAPLLIAGDFNDWNLKIHKTIVRTLDVKEAYTELYGKPALSFPSKLPVLPMDRIYFRHLTIDSATLLTGEPWNKLSDHCALSATFLYS